MKIIVKQTHWSGWDGGHSSERTKEYDIKLNEEVVVDSMEYTSTNSKGEEISIVQPTFSFKVLKVKENYLKLLVGGEAGGIYNKKKDLYTSQKVVLHLNKTLTFKTGWMDAGKSFEISIG